MYTPTYPSVSGEGGIGTYVRESARAFCAMGHQVHVVTPGSGSAVRDGHVHVHQCSIARLPVIDRLLPGAGACWRVGRAMTQLVATEHLDIVEFANWEGLAPYYAWQRSTPMVVRLSTSSLESIEIDELAMNRQLAFDVRRERWSARMADLLVTHSDAHRQHMARELGLDPHGIHLVPLGVQPAPRAACPVRRDEHTIVYLGRMERRKGTVDLLHAVPAVLQQFPQARFVLIGADRAHCPGGRTHAQYLAEEFPASVQGRVRLAGRLPDDEVDQWLRRATVFVAPSLYESFGLIFLEAMRWGTPVVGTRTGGIPEIVHDGHSGVLVEPHNPIELAAAINGLLADPARRRALGDAGRQRCEQEFSSDRMAARMAELYMDLIGRRQ
jgi:glycosyltransferase involved in cell wall biosynthesis